MFSGNDKGCLWDEDILGKYALHATRRRELADKSTFSRRDKVEKGNENSEGLFCEEDLDAKMADVFYVISNSTERYNINRLIPKRGFYVEKPRTFVLLWIMDGVLSIVQVELYLTHPTSAIVMLGSFTNLEKAPLHSVGFFDCVIPPGTQTVVILSDGYERNAPYTRFKKIRRFLIKATP